MIGFKLYSADDFMVYNFKLKTRYVSCGRCSNTPSFLIFIIDKCTW